MLVIQHGSIIFEAEVEVEGPTAASESIKGRAYRALIVTAQIGELSLVAVITALGRAGRRRTSVRAGLTARQEPQALVLVLEAHHAQSKYLCEQLLVHMVVVRLACTHQTL